MGWVKVYEGKFPVDVVQPQPQLRVTATATISRTSIEPGGAVGIRLRIHNPNPVRVWLKASVLLDGREVFSSRFTVNPGDKEKGWTLQFKKVTSGRHLLRVVLYQDGVGIVLDRQFTLTVQAPQPQPSPQPQPQPTPAPAPAPSPQPGAGAGKKAYLGPVLAGIIALALLSRK